MLKLLIIDDDIQICEAMVRIAEKLGIEAVYVQTLAQGKAKAEFEKFDFVILDKWLPDGNSLNAITEFKSMPSSPEIILFTGYPDPMEVDSVIKKQGAWSYLAKTSSLQEITSMLKQVMEFRANRNDLISTDIVNRGGIVGRSQAIEHCLAIMASAAATDSSVLIFGKTGTGKEVFARAIHENSPRKNNNFVAIDCGAMPDTLVESLLFGHTKGAFTGATKDVNGFVNHADKGTLFLDEVGELSKKGQQSLLRVLQDKNFHAVGSTEVLKSNFRLISASNRNLEEMVEKNEFRKDLLFRLNSVFINIPSLSERREDIKDLADYYLSILCRDDKNNAKEISPEFYDALNEYEWPGNVRELNSIIEYASVMAHNQTKLYPIHLPEAIRIAMMKKHLQSKIPTADPITEIMPWKAHRKAALEREEEIYLKAVMRVAQGNVKKACELSGISQTWLYELLSKHGIKSS